MLELQELRTAVQQGRYTDALVLIGEMEEMSHEDKINKIGSFLVVLLLHLIKQQAEKRSTRSWDISIRNAVREIIATNKRRGSKGFHMSSEELIEAIDERYPIALDYAALEAFEGRYEAEEIEAMVDDEEIKTKALQLILDAQSLNLPILTPASPTPSTH